MDIEPLTTVTGFCAQYAAYREAVLGAEITDLCTHPEALHALLVESLSAVSAGFRDGFGAALPGGW